MPARVGVAAQVLQQLGDLVDVAAVGRRPAAPLHAVDGTQLAVRAGPLVPDGDVVLAQVRDVGLAAQEPEQLVDDRAQVHPLGGDQREAGRQVEPHLVTEHAAGPRPGPVRLRGARLEHEPEEVLVRGGHRRVRHAVIVGRDRPDLRAATRCGRDTPGYDAAVPAAHRRRPRAHGAPDRRGMAAREHRAHVRGRGPGHHRDALRRRRRWRAGRPGRADGRRRRVPRVARDRPPRPGRAPAGRLRDADRPHRGHRRPGDRRGWQAARRVPRRGGVRRRLRPVVLRAGGPVRRAGPARAVGCEPPAGPAATGRPRAADHPVELPDRDDRPQGRPRWPPGARSSSSRRS